MPEAKPTETLTSEVNKLLKESKTRIPVSERHAPVFSKVTKLPVAESSGGKQLYSAKLFHVDRINSNARVYPRQVMQDNIDRLQPMLKDGYFCGSVDHGTGLAKQAIIWREVHIEPDGSAMGQFEIVANHSAGKDLQAQIDAGMAVGFSTYGYGTGHSPDKEEMAKYNDPEGESTIMDSNYELCKTDAVDDPSVTDARVQQSSKSGNPTAEKKAVAEGCSNGLCYKEIGECGHILSQCKCDVEEKHFVYKTKLCDRCAANKSNLSAEQFKHHFAEARKNKPVAEGVGIDRAPLAKSYTQYIQSKSGDSFEPTGPLTTAPTLLKDAYRLQATWSGVRFVRMVPQTDNLYTFPNSVMENVLSEIDNFWKLKPNYDKLGVQFNRGVIMEGPPGTGKTSALHQVSEMITAQGDVVFYARDISTLTEGLNAFREVEPERKCVVMLEDADAFIGYQEGAFLQLLDGEQSVSGVLYLATTNYIERFPARLKRPGRFDKIVHVGPPPYEGRHAYLEKKLVPMGETPEEIKSLATETDGLSFGHLRELVIGIYALKEPKSDVLSRLKGSPRKAVSRDNRLNEGRQQDTQLNVENVTNKVEANPMAENKQLVATINTLLKEAKGLEGIEVPTREVLPAEFAEQLKSANATIESHKAEAEKAKAEKAELEAKLATFAAEKADADRVSKITAKAAKALEKSVYAKLITSQLEKAAKDKAFTDANVDAFIAERTADYEEAAKLLNPAPTNVTTAVLGQDITEEDLDGDEVEEDIEVEPFEELNFGRKPKAKAKK